MSSSKLASDLDNTDFQGAMNPDSRLAVQFYTKPVQNEFQSEQQGRPIFTDMDFVKIFVPGDATTVIDTPVREEHKKRFPMHWQHYQNSHGGDAKEIGTPLSQWTRLTPSQVEELRALKFYTVENVAGASDANLQRLGMVAGMSPYAFRDHAIRFLKLAQEDSLASDAEARAKALEEENRKLREDAERNKQEMNAKFAEMAEKIAALASQPKPKRKYTKKTSGIVSE